MQYCNAAVGAETEMWAMQPKCRGVWTKLKSILKYCCVSYLQDHLIIAINIHLLLQHKLLMISLHSHNCCIQQYIATSNIQNVTCFNQCSWVGHQNYLHHIWICTEALKLYYWTPFWLVVWYMRQSSCIMKQSLHIDCFSHVQVFAMLFPGSFHAIYYRFVYLATNNQWEPSTNMYKYIWFNSILNPTFAVANSCYITSWKLTQLVRSSHTSEIDLREQQRYAAKGIC